MFLLRDPYLITLINVAIFLSLTLLLFIFHRLFPNKKINLLILLVIISIIPILSLFRPGTFEAGDLRTHTAQLLDFYINLKGGILVPRWAMNLCGKFGCPIYIIEYTLPYYFGSIFHLLGFSALNSIKLVFAFSFIASGITMYYWAKDEFGEMSGFIASLLYLFAPFHLIDVHFRGSVGETLAYVFIPLLFIFSKKIILSKDIRYFFLLSFSVLAIILSHSSTSLFILPISFTYGFLIWYLNKRTKTKKIYMLVFSFIYGALISAFYWLPAIIESKFTWWTLITYGDFTPLIKYLISPYYYGFLFQGHGGGWTPVLGFSHLIILFLGVYFIFKVKLPENQKKLLIFFCLTSFFLIFMMIQPSKIIWDNIFILHSFITVTRLFVPLSFLVSAIGGYIFIKIKNKKIVAIISFLIIFSTVLNWANRKMVPELDNPFLTTDNVYTEYFEKDNPIYIKKVNDPKNNSILVMGNPRPNNIEFISGKGEVINSKRSAENHQYTLYVSEDSMIKENTFYFPGWKTYANGTNIPINYQNEKNNSFGKITFSLKKGIYKVDLIYENTKIEKVSKIITFIFILIGFLYYIFYLHKKRPNQTYNRTSKTLK